jgi:predicted MPP superfamily phosphohydrolase
VYFDGQNYDPTNKWVLFGHHFAAISGAGPLIGPVLCPSWHGVKYASGTFYTSPTLMHVSRGVSAELPIRLNCRPELTKIVLRCSKTGPSQ